MQALFFPLWSNDPPNVEWWWQRWNQAAWDLGSSNSWVPGLAMRLANSSCYFYAPAPQNRHPQLLPWSPCLRHTTDYWNNERGLVLEKAVLSLLISTGCTVPKVLKISNTSWSFFGFSEKSKMRYNSAEIQGPGLEQRALGRGGFICKKRGKKWLPCLGEGSKLPCLVDLWQLDIFKVLGKYMID